MTRQGQKLLSTYLDGHDDPQLQTELAAHLEAHPGDLNEMLELLRDHAAMEVVLGTRREQLPQMVLSELQFADDGDTHPRTHHTA